MVKEVEYQALKSLKNDAVRGRGGKELVQNFSSKGSLAHIINGKTLRWAMASNEMALAEYLLENEVCPNLLQLALHLSSKKGNLDLCQILVSKGVNIDALDWTKRSPMFYAVFGNQNDMTNFLLEKGADPNGRGKRMKETLLHLAVRNGNFDICQKLVANGAALEALDSKNRTALSYAVMKNNIKITEYLLKNGANPNANVMTFHRSPYSGEPHICQTVLHVAVRYRFHKIVKLLIDNRANVNCLNSRGQTPLMLIIRRILFSCNEKVFNEKLAMAFLLMSKDAILVRDIFVYEKRLANILARKKSASSLKTICIHSFWQNTNQHNIRSKISSISSLSYLERYLICGEEFQFLINLEEKYRVGLKRVQPLTAF